MLADEELEWVYPRVSGEPPGPRGYHSAAASEDGSKVRAWQQAGPQAGMLLLALSVLTLACGGQG